MAIRAKVRFWRAENGWGVVDAPELPGGCYVNFTSVATDGYRSLTEGSWVNVEFEPSDAGSFRYAATRVWPEGSEPFEPTYGSSSEPGPYTSSLSIEYDAPPEH